MVTFDELKRYVLALREEEMNNNYRLSDSQVNLIKKVSQELKTDPELRRKLSQMLSARSTMEINSIKYQTKADDVEIIDLTPEEEISKENGKTYVFKKPKETKRAGYIDALVMALVTGFIGGIATSILLLMI